MLSVVISRWGMIDSDLGSHKVNVYPKVHQYGRDIPIHNVWSINSSSHSRKAVYPKVHHNVSLLDMIFQYGRNIFSHRQLHGLLPSRYTMKVGSARMKTASEL